MGSVGTSISVAVPDVVTVVRDENARGRPPLGTKASVEALGDDNSANAAVVAKRVNLMLIFTCFILPSSRIYLVWLMRIFRLIVKILIIKCTVSLFTNEDLSTRSAWRCQHQVMVESRILSAATTANYS